MVTTALTIALIVWCVVLTLLATRYMRLQRLAQERSNLFSRLYFELLEGLQARDPAELATLIDEQNRELHSLLRPSEEKVPG